MSKTEQPGQGSGSAAGALVVDALHRSAIGGIGVWQFVLVIAVMATPTLDHPVPVLLAHVLLMAALAFCLLRRGPASLCLAASYVLTAVDYAVTDDAGSALAFAAIWTACLTCATPALIMRRRTAIAVTATAIVFLTSAQIILSPNWPPSARLIVIVTSVTLSCGAHVLVRVMHNGATRADIQAARTHEAVRLERVARYAGRQLAEDARVLHDTVVNTLSAIARGGAGVADLRAVRDRCAQDVAAVAELANGRNIDAPDLSIEALRLRTGIHVDYSGPPTEDLERFESLLPADTSRAIRRAILELATNTAKHAGVGRVSIGITIKDAHLTVTVSDSGSGFDGRTIPRRGLAESVVRRCSEAGVHVDLRSTPGKGTTTTLSYSADGTPTARAEPASGLDPTSITMAGCWVWAILIVVADLAATLVRSPPVAGAAAATATAIGVLAVLCWWFTRGGRRLPHWLTFLVICSVPATFLTSLLTVHALDAPMTDLPAVLATVPLLILWVTSRSRFPLSAALVALGVAVAVAGAIMREDSPELTLLPIVAVCPQLGLFAGWMVFLPVLTRTIRRYERHRLMTLESEVASSSHTALTTARARWISAGTRSSAALLERIATGEASPRDPAIRRLCAEEESYLRQLISLDPGLIHMSPWFALALTQARARSLSLQVQAGGTDMPDMATAKAVGEVLLGVIDSCEPSDSVNVGLFSEGGEPLCLILGPHTIAASVRTVLDETGHLDHRLRHTSDFTLVTLRSRCDPPGSGQRTVDRVAHNGHPLHADDELVIS
ncbi:ATP-binding protein [Ruania alkalisoli]|uniref:ATP-binding protein n=1 Tax=Ruania alkalisoli TaxID=2779775 RepID=A0A7M1SWT0_9MICO|nr:ATP-binding protein [Ruania alkalisoli]QOR71083.1 ATP-binding protein [Ruania alkalisoli]